MAIVSGSGSKAIAPCARKKIDFLFSGEAKYGTAEELSYFQLSAGFYGHYSTETVGVTTLGEVLSKNFHIPFEFIDVPVLI